MHIFVNSLCIYTYIPSDTTGSTGNKTKTLVFLPVGCSYTFGVSTALRYVCVFTIFYITAQSGPVIIVIICHSHY